MAVYNFVCLSCAEGYEDFARSYDPSEQYPEIKCPKCGSFDKKKVPSIPAAAVFRQKQGTSKMDNFEYRAGVNMERAQAERRTAEEVSHMGDSPYGNIDDVSGGKFFGEVE